MHLSFSSSAGLETDFKSRFHDGVEESDVLAWGGRGRGNVLGMNGCVSWVNSIATARRRPFFTHRITDGSVLDLDD